MSKQSNGHHDAEDGTSIQKLQMENVNLNEQVQELGRRLSEATAQSNTSDIVSDSNSADMCPDCNISNPNLKSYLCSCGCLRAIAIPILI